jgi:hypothetical protein
MRRDAVCRTPAAVGFMGSKYECTPLPAATRRRIDRANAGKLFPRLACPISFVGYDARASGRWP